MPDSNTVRTAREQMAPRAETESRVAGAKIREALHQLVDALALCFPDGRATRGKACHYQLDVRVTQADPMVRHDPMVPLAEGQGNWRTPRPSGQLLTASR
jgi:hypothetical protein